MKPIALRLHPDTFTALHAAVDKLRKGSQNVTVPKEALLALLMDHSNVLAAAEQAGIKFEELP